MRICKQVKFIKGESLDDLQAKLNEALLEGAELKAIDIQTLTGAVIVTEYVGEIEKKELDLLEEEFGCHNCEECPFFKESTDKRRTWHTCTKEGKKVKKTSHCCSAYYKLIREEEKSEVSEDQRDDGLLRFESGRRSGLAEGLKSSGLRQAQRSVKVPSVGTRIPVNVFEDPGRRIIQGGGERC